MKVVIIGSGNVATQYAQRLYKNGVTILQIVGRNSHTGEALSKTINADYTSEYIRINKNADYYIISVQDDQLKNVIEQLAKVKLNNKLIVHTTGSASIELLANTSKEYGVLYPLQSLKKENIAAKIPLFIDGNTPTAKEKIRKLASFISDEIAEADDQQRLKLHIAAVLVSNFPNYLYTLADQLCKDNGLPFSYLLPLMKETVERLETFEPANMQTGPAVRNDQSTIKTHEHILQAEAPEIAETYQFLTEKIIKHFNT